MDNKYYHPLTEQIVDILIKKVNNTNRHYFRLLAAYYVSKVASMMRCNIEKLDNSKIPINTYVLNLMPSGAGKGHSTNIFEKELIEPFKKAFLSNVFPIQAEGHIATLAKDIATDRIAAGSPRGIQEEFEEVKNDLTRHFDRLGELAFSFDSATTPAVKQMREKLLLAGAGSMNLELDEVGSNLSSNSEVLTTFLELYDVGLVKQKLIKNTAENIRSRELPGETPTNLMMFGTPTKLLDGATTEDEFKQFLETGYARRLLFGFSERITRKSLSPQERLELMMDTTIASDMNHIQSLFAGLANRPFNHIIHMPKETTLHLLTYQTECEKLADVMKDHQVILKAEMEHRYYKVQKLAGAYAFIDGVSEMQISHVNAAISLVEDSGTQFHKLMEKKGSYERLAKYLADIGREVTQHELLEDLPFYRGSENQRRDLMSLAMSYGYRNNIVIKCREQDGIEFFTGESLSKIDLNNVNVSISNDLTHGFTNPDPKPAFDQLHKLTTAKGLHYCANSFVNNYRSSENAIPGFDLLILDIDEGTTINTAKLLMEEYTFLLSTTKRHTEEKNRFRMILPMSHVIKLNKTEYSQFMENVFEWLPFDVDTSTKDIARKWETFPGKYFYNSGELIDATQFIPQTRRSNDIKSKLTIDGVTNIEKWFLVNTAKGNRATHLYRYGMVLIDAGLQLGEIIEKLEKLNASLDLPLPEDQLRNSTFKSISKELQKRG